MVIRLLVMVLVWTLTPGLAEVAENVWHLATTGHAAHAVEQGADHEPVGDEHGCTGPFHLCSCHHSQAFDLLPALEALRQGPQRRAVTSATPDLPLDPTLPRLDRPPRV